MFSLIKQVLIVLLSFSESLVRVTMVLAKYLSLDDEPCMARSTLFDLNPAALKHHPFMISKCNGSCNVFLQKYVFQRKRHKL